MVIFKSLFVFLFVFFIAAGAKADEPAKGVSLEYEGKPGIWLTLESHQSILVDLKQLPKYRERVSLLESKLALQAAQIDDLRASVELAVQSRDQAVGAVEEAVRGRREAEESRDAWHRSRVLWFGIGFVAAVAITYGAVKIIEVTK